MGDPGTFTRTSDPLTVAVLVVGVAPVKVSDTVTAAVLTREAGVIARKITIKRSAETHASRRTTFTLNQSCHQTNMPYVISIPCKRAMATTRFTHKIRVQIWMSTSIHPTQ
jgi:hypothetical protein